MGPLLAGGYPISAYPQYGLFYPVNLIFWYFAAWGENSYSYLVIIHYFIAGIGGYVLGRTIGLKRIPSFVTGFVFMFSHYLITFIVWPNNLQGLVWFPIELALIIRVFQNKGFYYVPLAGLVYALVILPSPAQPFIQVSLLMFAVYFYLLFKEYPLRSFKQNVTNYVNKLIPFFAVLGIGLSLASLSLFPVMEFIPKTTRFIGADGAITGLQKLSFASFTRYHMSLKAVPGFLWKELSGMDVGAVFVGIILLILSGVAIFYIKDKKYKLFKDLFLYIGVFSLLYSVGKIGLIVYPAYYIPFIDKIREPSRYLILVALSLSVLSGIGLQFLTDNNYNHKTAKSVFVWFVGITILFWINRFFDLSRLTLKNLLLVVIISVVFLIINHLRNQKLFAISMVLVLVVELLYFNLGSYNNFLDNQSWNTKTYYAKSKKLADMLPKNSLYRVVAI